MHLYDFPLPDYFLISIALLVAFILGRALVTAPWKALFSLAERQHIYYAAIALMALLWEMKISWIDGLILHPMAVTALTVVFGWHLAIIAGFVGMIIFTLLNDHDWWMLAVNFIPTVLVPASIAAMLIRKVLALRSNNLFIFLLGIGFFGAIVSVIVAISSILLLAYMTDNTVFIKDLWDSVVIIAMIIYAEGFLNGMLVSALTVFAPDIVKTFDTTKYLGK